MHSLSHVGASQEPPELQLPLRHSPFDEQQQSPGLSLLPLPQSALESQLFAVQAPFVHVPLVQSAFCVQQQPPALPESRRPEMGSRSRRPVHSLSHVGASQEPPELQLPLRHWLADEQQQSSAMLLDSAHAVHSGAASASSLSG